MSDKEFAAVQRVALLWCWGVVGYWEYQALCVVWRGYLEMSKPVPPEPSTHGVLAVVVIGISFLAFVGAVLGLGFAGLLIKATWSTLRGGTKELQNAMLIQTVALAVALVVMWFGTGIDVAVIVVACVFALSFTLAWAVIPEQSESPPVTGPAGP